MPENVFHMWESIQKSVQPIIDSDPKIDVLYDNICCDLDSREKYLTTFKMISKGRVAPRKLYIKIVTALSQEMLKVRDKLKKLKGFGETADAVDNLAENVEGYEGTSTDAFSSAGLFGKTKTTLDEIDVEWKRIVKNKTSLKLRPWLVKSKVVPLIKSLKSQWKVCNNYDLEIMGNMAKFRQYEDGAFKDLKKLRDLLKKKKKGEINKKQLADFIKGIDTVEKNMKKSGKVMNS